MTNKVQDAFGSVKADYRLKDSTKQYLAERRQDKPKRLQKPAFRRMLAAVCAVFLLAAGINGYLWVKTPAAYVSIDVNPSLELELNRFDRVLAVTAYNTEGEEILSELSLEWKIYTEAIAEIMDCESRKGYLTDESELVFTVAADSRKEQELKAGAESCSGHAGHSCQSVSADMEAVSKAHDSGMSLGKYYAYLQLLQYDDTMTEDQCRHMSMSEIHGRILEHEHGGSQNNGNAPSDQEDQYASPEQTDTNKREHHHDHGGSHE